MSTFPWKDHYAPPAGQVADQALTLAPGTHYALTSSGTLSQTASSTPYFMELGRRGLRFNGDVYADYAMTFAAYNSGDFCAAAYYTASKAGAVFPWRKRKQGTEFCARPTREAKAVDFIIAIRKTSSGHQVTIDFSEWDQAPTRAGLEVRMMTSSSVGEQ